MKCLKCIHHDVCALYTYSGYASDECGFYETRTSGEWIDHETYTVCGNCGKHFPVKKYRKNYCENCGSDNRKRGEAE